MILGKVIGTATATVKHPALAGQKLLVVRAGGEPVLAIDTIGAGAGSEVVITSDGGFATELLKTKAAPIRWSVIGIADSPRIRGNHDES